MRQLIAIVGLGLGSVLSLGGSASSSAATTATVLSPGWGKAEPVPGLAALTAKGLDSGLNSVSCGSAGNCGAGGFYQVANAGHTSDRAFVVSQVAGTWGQAEPVPGLAALDKGQDSQVTAVSCASPGNCTAGGVYSRGNTIDVQGESVFVVSQVRGRWGQARPLPGFGALDLGLAGLASVSCASPGNCAAGGFDSPPRTNGGGCCQRQGFVASQINGVWGKPHQVPGTQEIDSVSCPAPGDCAAAGRLVLSETGGRWTKPILVRGDGGQARLTSVSCAAPGNCGAVGYLDARVKRQLHAVAAAAASLTHGTWSLTAKIAGLSPGKPPPQETPDGPVLRNLTAVACPGPGQCVAGGDTILNVEAGSSTQVLAVAFLAHQVGRTWSSARRVPGIAALSKSRYDVVTALSCSAPGDCVIAGAYAVGERPTEDTGFGQAFVATELHGRWHPAIAIKAQAGVPAQVAAVACPAASRCTAVGASFFPSDQQAFVLDQTPG
jgi:hypothetical protein